MTKIIDCTIRDGGHLNGWNFSEDCVRASYQAAVKTGIEYFETGYRFDTPNPEWGKFAQCEDIFLFSLFGQEPECKISVMIDAGKCSLDKFCTCKPELTVISLVRVATYPENLDLTFELCSGLKKKGYDILLNLMAISKYKNEDFEKLKNWEQKQILTSLCFADSFGSLFPSDIEKYHDKLKSIGFENISFHSHNNLQLAFANSLKAIEKGFYSIDASIYGMGRGAGNLPIEILVGYLKRNPTNYIDVIQKFYIHLAEQTPWGYGVKSLIGGLKDVHPNEIDNYLIST